MTAHRFSAAAKARAERAYFHEPHRTLAEIAATELAITSWYFSRCIRAWGWPPRQAVKAALREQAERQEAERQRAGQGDGSPGESPGNALGTSLNRSLDHSLNRSLGERLERLLAQRLRAAERAPDDLDRALAPLPKLVAALAALKTFEQTHPDTNGSAHDAPPPRSLDELRQELARHLDRLEAQERRAGRNPKLHRPGDRAPD